MAQLHPWFAACSTIQHNERALITVSQLIRSKCMGVTCPKHDRAFTSFIPLLYIELDTESNDYIRKANHQLLHRYPCSCTLLHHFGVWTKYLSCPFTVNPLIFLENMSFITFHVPGVICKDLDTSCSLYFWQPNSASYYLFLVVITFHKKREKCVWVREWVGGGLGRKLRFH